jgi:hypothetical protein
MLSIIVSSDILFYFLRLIKFSFSSYMFSKILSQVPKISMILLLTSCLPLRQRQILLQQRYQRKYNARF